MSVTNAAAANAALDSVRADKRERRVQAAENLSTKQWLETELESQAQPYPVMGREFNFRPIGNERVEEILELAAQEAEQLDGKDVDDLDDVESDDLEDMPRFVRSMRETLEEACLDDYMAEEGLKLIPLDILQAVFEDVAMGAELSQHAGNGR